MTDTHFGARNDSLSFSDYFFKFYDECFFPYIAEHNVKQVVHLGDIVDRRKYINFVILNRMKRQFIFRLRDMGVALDVIIGNHDVPYRNTNKINAMNELFGSSGNYPTFHSEPTVIEFDGTPIMLMPWINSSNYSDAIDAINVTQSKILFGHLEIQGFEMLRGIINDQGLTTNVFDKFEIVYSGHFHHKSTQENITYLGAPYEITWSDYQDPRGFHIFDTETHKLEFIQNPFRMFHKIFYDDEGKTLSDVVDLDYDQYYNTVVKVIVNKKTQPYWFDVVIDKLYKSAPFKISIVEGEMLREHFSESDIIDEAEDTLTILEKYITGINIDTDKPALVKMMRSLYTEAINIEE